jgi:hypothetical protein
MIIMLIVILVGITCAVLLFDFTYHLACITQLQKNIYVDHVTALDAIQTVKEYILATNNASGKTMHPLGFNCASSEIKDLSVIRFSDSALNGERFVRNEAGVRRLEISVYDLSYNPHNLKEPLLGDWGRRSELPPSIDVTEQTIIEEDKAASGTRPSDRFLRKDTTIDPEKCGAYLIRVKLYDTDKDDSEPTHMAEEAFVQILH